MELSVCILTSGRLPIFQKCYESVVQALPEKAEIRVIVNGPDTETLQWLAEQKETRLTVTEVPKEPRTRSRNRAFELCGGRILYFLDDDVIVPIHLFEMVLNLFQENAHLSVIGGPNLTPQDSSFLEKMFGAVMTSFFAAPMVRLRYGGGTRPGLSIADSRHLILCNLAVRQADIPKQVRFRETLTSNEENLFLFHCSENQLEMAFVKEAYVYHRRRKTLKAFLSQIFSYGKGRGEQTVISPKSCHLFFLIPAFCILFGLGFVASDLTRPLLPPLIGIYLVLSILGAILSTEARSLGLGSVASTVVFTPLVHISYGMGLIMGLGIFPNLLSQCLSFLYSLFPQYANSKRHQVLSSKSH